MRMRRGFTLLEMLLAIAITLLIAGTLATSIGIGFKAKNATETAIEQMRDVATFGDVMAKDLSTTVQPATASTDPANATVYYLNGSFIGSNTLVDFYCSGTEPHGLVQGDVKFVEYALVEDGSASGQGLVRRVDTNLLADPGTSPLQEEVLVHNVVNLVIRYWDGTQWNDGWDSTDPNYGNTLPLAVAVRLELGPATAGGPNRLIDRYIPLWCALPASAASQGSVP